MEEEDLDEYNFNIQIDKAYYEMEMTDLNMEFVNMTFVPSNAHVLAWAYCTICENFGHNECDH